MTKPNHGASATRRRLLTTLACWIATMAMRDARVSVEQPRARKQSATPRTPDTLFDVTAFGEVGQDDDALLRLALATEQRILIPSGVTLTIKSDVVIPAGKTLVGAGATSRIRLRCNDAADNIKIRLSDNSALRSLALEETEVKGRSGVYGTIFAEGVRRCVIYAVDVSGSSSAGMLFINCSDITISGCSVHDTRADGIHSQRGTRRVAISDCTITRTGDDGIAFVSHGYDRYGRVSDCTVNRCRITNMTDTGSGVGIIGAVGISVTNCMIDGTPMSGIRITSADFPGEGSTIGERIHITANAISNTGRGSPRGNNGGIFIEGNRNVVVSGNRIRRPATWGIATSNAVAGIRIAHNTIADPGDVGLFISASPQRGSYAALDGNAQGDVVGGRDIAVESNAITNPLGAGIHVFGTRTQPILGLTLRKNVVRGVRPRPSGMQTCAIRVDHVSNLVLSGNVSQSPVGRNSCGLLVGSQVRIAR